MATWEDVRRVTATLPETVEHQPHEWRARGKPLAWGRPLRAALGAAAPQDPILGVRVADVGVADALLADDPAVYFTIPHFAGYPAILVRLPEIDPEELREVLVDAWLALVPKRMRRRTSRQNHPPERSVEPVLRASPPSCPPARPRGGSGDPEPPRTADAPRGAVSYFFLFFLSFFLSFFDFFAMGEPPFGFRPRTAALTRRQ